VEKVLGAIGDGWNWARSNPLGIDYLMSGGRVAVGTIYNVYEWFTEGREMKRVYEESKNVIHRICLHTDKVEYLMLDYDLHARNLAQELNYHQIYVNLRNLVKEHYAIEKEVGMIYKMKNNLNFLYLSLSRNISELARKSEETLEKLEQDYSAWSISRIQCGSSLIASSIVGSTIPVLSLGLQKITILTCGKGIADYVQYFKDDASIRRISLFESRLSALLDDTSRAIQKIDFIRKKYEDSVSNMDLFYNSVETRPLLKFLFVFGYFFADIVTFTILVSYLIYFRSKNFYKILFNLAFIISFAHLLFEMYHNPEIAVEYLEYIFSASIGTKTVLWTLIFTGFAIYLNRIQMTIILLTAFMTHEYISSSVNKWIG
jgi:hypothetical protein